MKDNFAMHRSEYRYMQILNKMGSTKHFRTGFWSSCEGWVQHCKSCDSRDKA